MNQKIELLAMRVPPQAIDSEMSVLGSLLLENRTYDQIVGILCHDDFYQSEHKLIYKTIVHMIESHKPADVVTVYERLKREGRDEEVGGLDYLNSLAQYVPSASAIFRYAEHVRDRSILRQLARVGDEIAASAFDGHSRATQSILEDAERKILAIGEKGSVASENMKLVSEELGNYLDDLQSRADNADVPRGVQTGYSSLDALTDGFMPGDLIVIAGRPSMGKTSFAMNIVEHAAIKQKLSVLVISLEMSRMQLVGRMIGSVGRIDQTRLKQARPTSEEWNRITVSTSKLQDTKIEVQEIGAETISQIRAAARRGARKHRGLGLIVVDYLQLLNGEHDDGSFNENRATEVAKISRGLKLLAREMGCPIIALSQLNRGVENRPDKRPMMADLRESGAVEQDADTILFVYRDEVYSKEACREPGIAEIIVAKQRSGPTGTVKLTWRAEYTRFDN